jgi:hypothetical protein
MVMTIDPGPVGTYAGPQIPRREVWLTLPGEYADFRVKVWRNFPQRLKTDLRSGDPATVLDLLALAEERKRNAVAR